METLEKKGKGSALLPFLLFIIIYLGAGLYYQAKGVEMAFYQFPSVTAMFIAVLLAFCMGKGSIDEKFAVFAKGAANENVLTCSSFSSWPAPSPPWPVPWAVWIPP